MDTSDKTTQDLLRSLSERAKELHCLYRVDEILLARDRSEEETFRALVEAIPAGWQHPNLCVAVVRLAGKAYHPEGFAETPWKLEAPIVMEGVLAGSVAVYYTQKSPKEDEGPFLKEERRLIHAIAERLGQYLMQERLRRAHQRWQGAMETLAAHQGGGWQLLLDFLHRTDPRLLLRITRKMVNHLYWHGITEARDLLQEFGPETNLSAPEDEDENRPRRKHALKRTTSLSKKTFELAARYLPESEILACLQSWIKEEKSGAVMSVLENSERGLTDVAESLEKFQSEVDEKELTPAGSMSLRVSLLRRCFTEQIDFINVGKHYVEINDFRDLLRRILVPAHGQGKLGGKSAGLFLARKIIEWGAQDNPLLSGIRVPETWYVASDSLLEFIHHNNLEELYNRKYMEVDRIRQDYPYTVQLFKNSPFPPEMVQGLSGVLDEVEDCPLIVRSSSLLEDRAGSAFSGKYKSLFLANQGTKRERLEALLDAVAEVYASVFGPDPIEYRAERELLDVNEEMGIMIQKVVGQRVGRYFFPSFSGVAFSYNAFRWSPRIRREDGLLRLVPGLGTRAVDRLSDDYPTLISPGQPGLRVNVTDEEVVRYSPRKMDVIDCEARSFVTLEVQDLLHRLGDEIPGVRQMVSVHGPDGIHRPSGLGPDWERDECLITFAGILEEGDFLPRMRALMETLSEKIGSPVDLEFAHDGKDLYLLQCRTQSYSEQHAPAAIPRNIPRKQVLFTANRHVTNGRLLDITHVVYVDPESYARIEDGRTLYEVARAIGKLNRVLPRRKFLLMGPGRWGSRGDIRLGVPVTYSDISNAAALVEVARRQGNYVPELSFGTHFFQDLVEADIRYIPLYPDDPGIVFNELFLTRSRSVFPDLVPEFAALSRTIRVIDVNREADGQGIQILMNEELGETVALLTRGTDVGGRVDWTERTIETEPQDYSHWRWQMAERLADHLEADRYGVRGLYLFGSVKNGTAGPGSDIDLIVHFTGTEPQREALSLWLEGWSQSLGEINFLRTGYRSPGLLDIHFVTDEDLAKQTSYAAKITAVTDGARPLQVRGKGSR